MNLHEKLPELEEPYYILDTPAPIRWVLVSLMVCAPPIAFGWIYAAYHTDSLAFPHYAIGLIALVWFSALFNRNNLRRWVSFAADRKGVYIGNMRYEYVFVPWSEVGEISVGYAARQKTVVLELKVPDETWHRIFPPHPLRVLDPSWRLDTRKFGIGNNCRNVARTRENIERIRRIAAGDRSDWRLTK